MVNTQCTHAIPSWTPRLLIGAGVYYLALALSSFLWPASWFWASGITPTDLEQSLLLLHVAGTPLFVLSFGAFVALLNPKKFWLVLAMLCLHNLIDVLVNVNAVVGQRISVVSGILFVAVGVFFTFATGRVLWGIYQEYIRVPSEQAVTLESALALFPHGENRSLAELSDTGDVLLVLIRHTGCTFCREALDRLAQELKRAHGPIPTIVVVGLSPVDSIREVVQQYGLSQAYVVSDKEQRIYRALELPRGTLWQLFGPRELWSAIVKGGLAKYGLGKVEGDPFQLPGTALIRNRKLVSVHRPKSAADFCELAPFVQPAT